MSRRPRNSTLFPPPPLSRSGKGLRWAREALRRRHVPRRRGLLRLQLLQRHHARRVLHHDRQQQRQRRWHRACHQPEVPEREEPELLPLDRKSTRLNSSH